MKDTNPKDALGVRKAGLHLISWPFIYAVAVAMLEGARKYAGHNYRKAGVRESVYFNAAVGHLVQFHEGEDEDPESQIHHLAKAAASIAVLYDAVFTGNWTDDRPPKLRDRWKSIFDGKACWVIDNVRPDDPLPPCTNVEHGPAEGDAAGAEDPSDDKFVRVPLPAQAAKIDWEALAKKLHAQRKEAYEEGALNTLRPLLKLGDYETWEQAFFRHQRAIQVLLTEEEPHVLSKEAYRGWVLGTRTVKYTGSE